MTFSLNAATDMLPLVTIAPPPIPVGCICAYTWHPSYDGRSVRNGPLSACPADHTAIDQAARRD